MERGKMRGKLAIYRDKITELEKRIAQAQEESAHLKKSAETSELLRSEISRKDATIKSQKDALQKSRESLSYTQESSSARNHDLEKQIR
jgi:uncharacterized small protein (DUF1192 family)